MIGKLQWRLRVDEWPRIIQEWGYPPTCMLCDAPGYAGLDLCAACRDNLPYSLHACPRCAAPLPDAAAALCGPCQKKPPPFDATVALCRFQEPVRYLIHALKFHRRQAAARLLGELLAVALQQRPQRPEVLIPVPLHAGRYAERGFNQALEIARPLAQRLLIPLEFCHCRRIRPTLAQTALSAQERRRNLRGAFQVDSGFAPQHVALLDDVVTTGATVGELARTLKRAGVQQVEVWCVARAGGQE